MNNSLKALMSGLIDYAGLFPPASLELDKALREFSGHQKDSAKAMLSRFICPPEKLALIEFGEEKLAPEFAPYRFSVLLGGQETREAFLYKLPEALTLISDFKEKHGEKVVPDAIEIKLSAEILDVEKKDAVYDFLGMISDSIFSSRFFSQLKSLTSYYELALTPEEWEKRSGAFIKGISKHNSRFEKGSAPYSGSAFKLRTGGLKADDFPSSKRIAFAILSCRDNFIPFKATAGLHHPLRRFQKSVQTKMHGFFNVFGGGVLAHARGLSAAHLNEVLDDEKEDHFHFDEQRFSWKTISATIAEIKTARCALMHSFGSCSFLEPKEDLEKLGLL